MKMKKLWLHLMPLLPPLHQLEGVEQPPLGAVVSQPPVLVQWHAFPVIRNNLVWRVHENLCLETKLSDEYNYFSSCFYFHSGRPCMNLGCMWPRNLSANVLDFFMCWNSHSLVSYSHLKSWCSCHETCCKILTHMVVRIAKPPFLSHVDFRGNHQLKLISSNYCFMRILHNSLGLFS